MVEKFPGCYSETHNLEKQMLSESDLFYLLDQKLNEGRSLDLHGDLMAVGISLDAGKFSAEDHGSCM